MSRRTKRRSAVIDEFLESYTRWREACEHVRAAYRRWQDATPQQHGVEYASYRVALDLEEHAATIYSDQAERLGALAG